MKGQFGERFDESLSERLGERFGIWMFDCLVIGCVNERFCERGFVTGIDDWLKCWVK